MIYTIGHKETYDKYMLDPIYRNSYYKVGRTKTYEGGIVFKSVDDAEDFLRNTDRIPGYGIYAVDANLETDTVADEHGLRWLLVTSPVISSDLLESRMRNERK